MKNKFLLVLAIVLAVMPMYASAEVKEIKKEDYTSMNLEQTLLEEGIEKEFTSYSENDNQITIYLFRGKGCTYCKKFLTFLNSITDEYGKYFKLESYEVWYDKKNSGLLEELSEFLDEDAGGVPYIVIGDNVFPGYTEQYDESIKAAIVSLYESQDRYDVFEAIAKEYKEQNKVDYSQAILVIVFDFIFIATATGLILWYCHSKDENLNKKIDELQKLMISEKEETKTTKKSETKPKKKTENKKAKNKTNTKKNEK